MQTTTTPDNTAIAGWTATSNAVPLVGDYNHDGTADIAVTGPSTWQSVGVALSKGDGTFQAVNQRLNKDFPLWSSMAQRFVGDFTGDGMDDIALAGGPTDWESIPVASSNGDGTFTVTNTPLGSNFFPSLASGAKILMGDFNNDGKKDLGLTGPSSWASLPVAFSNGDGSFTITNQPLLAFAGWSGVATTLLGDYNGDKKTDVALTGVSGWNTLPVAFSLSQGITP